MKKKTTITIISVLALAVLICVGIWFRIDSDEKSQTIPNRNRMRLEPEEGDNLFNLGDGYAYFGKNVYYKGGLIDGANGIEFENLGFGYAKDDKYVFYEGKILNGADVETFKKFDGQLNVFADKMQGYYLGESMKLSEAEELKKFLSDDVGGKNLKGNYRMYRNGIYYWYDGRGQSAPGMVLTGADPETFQVIGLGFYGKDKSIVVYKGQKVEGVNLESFKIAYEKYCSAETYVLASDNINYYSNGDSITKDEFNKYVEAVNAERTPGICVDWKTSKEWKLVHGNRSDSCSRPRYSGDVSVNGWYEWGTNYASKEWLLRVDDKDLGKLFNGYTGLYSLQNISENLKNKLEKADRNKPVSVRIKEIGYYCEGLPWVVAY